MGGWMRFAIDRKRQVILLAAVLAAAVLAGLFRLAGARTYTITDGSRVVTYTTFATDPEEVLGEAGLFLEEYDTYQTGGRDIRICRAQRVAVSHYGTTHLVSSLGETVGELLERTGLSPASGDRLSHSPDTGVWDGMEISVDRVITRQEVYSAAVPYETQLCLDASLPWDVREVLIPGRNGELLCVAEVTYVNGKEASRNILRQTMTAAPVTEIIAVGTSRQTGTPEPQLRIEDGYIRLPTGEVLRYYDSAQVRATAYTHTDAGCDMITYTGTTVRIGTVAVDPRVIPYGTRMFIVSNDGCYVYGISVAEDCGGAIKGDRIDLYFPTYEECMQFGRRDCTVYFLG